MGLTYQIVPLEPAAFPGVNLRRDRPSGPFRANYSQTVDLLDKELACLDGREIVLQVDVERSEIRLDGTLRADAKPKSPAIVLSFKSKHGPLSYPCDQYAWWQDNLRAIALALEALRAVDRYGVTKKAEQYKGWQALPDARMVAAELLKRLVSADPIKLLSDKAYASTCCRQAEMLTHPDRGGQADDFKRVQEARELLT